MIASVNRFTEGGISMAIVNLKSNVKKCAFCKHWYDPTNSAIEPKAPNIGLWEVVDTRMRKKCLLYNSDRPAMHFCSKFEMKL